MFDEAHTFWKSLRESFPELANFKVSKKGRLEQTDDQTSIIVEIQKSKFWSSDRLVAVDVFVGLKWPDDDLNSQDGWSYRDIRLSERGIADKWWELKTDANLELFKADVLRLMEEKGIPFITQCKTLSGAYEWMVENEPATVMLKHCLALKGRTAFTEQVKLWLRTYPRGLDRVFDWLEQTGVFENGIMETYKKKSWQHESLYQEYVNANVKQLSSRD